MDSHWKDVLLLLRGDANIGVICDALIDIIDINLHYLPDVFHEVSFALLTQCSMNTRVNSSLLLGKLCSHFSSILIPLICDSNTDGVLIQLEDIDIESIVRCHGSILYNVKVDAEIGGGENLYTQDWLKRQRKELLKQIGLHSYSTDLVSNEVLDHIDIGLEGFLPDIGNSTSNGSNDATSPSDKKVQVNLSKAPTNETWLARIMRCMISGLMSPQWECRHGYAIGLNQMVDNLSSYPYPHNQMHNTLSNRYVDRVLPEFLSNDILSCGLCVLLLDRFMDFDSSSDCILSPVKESVGELLSTALRSTLSVGKYELFGRLVTEMMLSDHHWTISLGGLIACRHFIVIKFDMVFFDKYENLMFILQSKLDGARGRADEDEMNIEIAKLLLALNNEVVNRFSAARIQEYVFRDEHLFVSRVSIMTKVLTCLLYKLHVLEDALDQPRAVELEQMTSNHLMLLMDVQLSSCSALFHLLSYSTAKDIAHTERELIAATEQLTLLLTMQSDLLVHANRHNDCQLQIHCFSNLFRSVIVMRDILKLRMDLNDEPISCLKSETIANHAESCFILFGRILAFVSMIPSANGTTNVEPSIPYNAPVQPSKATMFLMKNLSNRSLWSDCAIAVIELVSLGFFSMYRPPYKDNKIDQFFLRTLTTIMNIVLADICNKDDPTASCVPACTIADEECMKLVSYAVRAFRLMSSSFHVHNLWTKGSDLLRSRFIVFMTRLISYAMDPPTSQYEHIIDYVYMTLEDFSKFIRKSCQTLLDNCKLSDERQNNKPKRTFAFVFVADTSIADKGQSDDSTHRKIDGRKRKRPMDTVDESITSDVGTLKRKSPRDISCYELQSLMCFSVEVFSTLTKKMMVGSIDWQSMIMHDFDHAVRVVAKGTQRSELCIILRFLASVLSTTTSEPLASLLHGDEDPLDLSDSCNTVISNSIVKNMIDQRNDSKDHHVDIMIEQLMQLGRNNGSLSNIARLVVFSASQALKHKAFELFLPVIEESLKTDSDSCYNCIQFIPCLMYAFKRDDTLCSADEDRVIKLLLDAIGRNTSGLTTAVDGEEYVTCIVDSICALLYSPTVRSDISMSRKKNIHHLYSLSQWTSKQRTILNRIIEFIYASISSSAKTVMKSISTKLFVQLSLRLKENIIICYQKWFSTALYGLGDADAGIRRSSIEVFRMVVPMAPIAKLRSHQKCREEGEGIVTTIGDLPKVAESSIEDEGDSALSQVLLNLFSKETSVRIDLSKTNVDMKIIATLQRLTNLVDSSLSAHRSSTIKPLSSAKLRDYQWSGVSWLTQLRRFGLNGILADDMGIGKSIQALTMLAIIRIEKDFNTYPSIVVCPASLLLHWSDEVQKFFPPELLSPIRIMKQSDFITAIQNASSASVCLVSYDMLRREMTHTHASSLLREQQWELVVLDEAHLIKNPLTETAKCIFQLRGKHRIALTGTPIQNQVQELWSLMNFILPDYLGPYKVFESEVVRPLKRSYIARQSLLQSVDTMSQSNSISNKVYSAIEITSEGLTILRKLHKQILPFILRRTKFAVAKELPSKTIIDIICPLSEIQTQLYRSYQTKCDINDDILEKELGRLKHGELVEEDEDIINTADIHNKKGDPDDDEFQSNLDGWSTGNSIIAPSSQKKVSGYHPFKALSYLKLLCVHPAMVVEEQHASYRKHLLEMPTSSGKLLRLVSLLLESGVITADEISPEADYNDLLHLGTSQHPTSSGHRGASDAVASEGEDSPNSSDQEDGSIGDHKDAKKRGVGDSKVAIVDPSASPSIHRCLIFAQHKATLDLVESCVLQRYFPSINYERLDGDTNAHKRSIIAKAFNDQQLNPMGSEVELEQNIVTFSENIKDLQAEKILQLRTTFPKMSQSTKETKCCVDNQKDIRLLLMTTRSCGLGLNLTAADTVIFVENDWNPCVDQQAMDRSHRIGQSQPVTVYRLLAQSTIEARIMSLQELKQQVAAQVLNGDGAEDTTQDAASNNNFGRVLWDSLLQNDQVK